jgi:hypothetical protein
MKGVWEMGMITFGGIMSDVFSVKGPGFPVMSIIVVGLGAAGGKMLLKGAKEGQAAAMVEIAASFINIGLVLGVVAGAIVAFVTAFRLNL